MSLAIYPELGRYLTERSDTMSKRYSLGEDGIADVKRGTRRLERRQARLTIAEQLVPVPELPVAFADEAGYHRERRFLEDLRELRPWMGQECGDLYCHICGVDSVWVA